MIYLMHFNLLPLVMRQRMHRFGKAFTVLGVSLLAYLLIASLICRPAHATGKETLIRVHGNAFVPESTLQLSRDGTRHMTWGSSCTGTCWNECFVSCALASHPSRCARKTLYAMGVCII